MFQMRWRGHPLPRGAALIYRAELWRRKRKIARCDVVPESQDTNWILGISQCSTTASSPSEFSNIVWCLLAPQLPIQFTIKLTCSYSFLPSNKIKVNWVLPLFFSTAEAVLQKMDDMQKMRRRLRDRDTKEEVIILTGNFTFNFKLYTTLCVLVSRVDNLALWLCVTGFKSVN